MPPKRKGDEPTSVPSARERKKLRLADARMIAVQPVASGSSERQGHQQTNYPTPVAGPSKTVMSLDSTFPYFATPSDQTDQTLALQGLPATIDVERFTEVRSVFTWRRAL